MEGSYIDPDLLDAYRYDFPDWVAGQKMQSSIFTCDSDIRIDHPFADDERMFALWASQDCKDFDLLLTVMIDEQSEANLVGFAGANLSDKECVIAENWGAGVYACEYDLPANGQPLGILFKGGFRPIYYTTQWTLAQSWVPAFSWW